MNDVLTSFAAGLLYGPDYRSFDDSGRRPAAGSAARSGAWTRSSRRASIRSSRWKSWSWTASGRPGESAGGAAGGPVGAALRSTLRRPDGKLYADDAEFFRDGVFVVSPHRAQIRAIRRELRRQRRWQSPPVVDTVDKMQGQEAHAVVVSYGVSDPEFAAEEAEFIYGLNRLNVAMTRARSKCIVCLPRPLLEAPPQVLDLPEAARGLAFMRALVEAVARCGDELTFELDDGARATRVPRGRMLCAGPPRNGGSVRAAAAAKRRVSCRGSDRPHHARSDDSDAAAVAEARVRVAAPRCARPALRGCRSGRGPLECTRGSATHRGAHVRRGQPATPRRAAEPEPPPKRRRGRPPPPRPAEPRGAGRSASPRPADRPTGPDVRLRSRAADTRILTNSATVRSGSPPGTSPSSKTANRPRTALRQVPREWPHAIAEMDTVLARLNDAQRQAAGFPATTRC